MTIFLQNFVLKLQTNIVWLLRVNF
jgi:hypothetical protein